MAGFVAHAGAVACCAHGGNVVFTGVPRVRVSGMPVAIIATLNPVAGCVQPAEAGGPCRQAQWVVGSARVRVAGQPLVLSGTQGVALPLGAPVTLVSTQGRVRAR